MGLKGAWVVVRNDRDWGLGGFSRVGIGLGLVRCFSFSFCWDAGVPYVYIPFVKARSIVRTRCGTDDCL